MVRLKIHYIYIPHSLWYTLDIIEYLLFSVYIQYHIALKKGLPSRTIYATSTSFNKITSVSSFKLILWPCRRRRIVVYFNSTWRIKPSRRFKYITSFIWSVIVFIILSLQHCSALSHTVMSHTALTVTVIHCIALEII